MWRLTSADKGRTDAAASFRRGGKNQAGVALAAKLSLPSTFTWFQTIQLVPRVFPHKQTHKHATLFLISHLFSSLCSCLLSLSLSTSISSTPDTHKLLNPVSEVAVSLIKSFKLLCSRMSAALKSEDGVRRAQSSAHVTPPVPFISSPG